MRLDVNTLTISQKVDLVSLILSQETPIHLADIFNQSLRRLPLPLCEIWLLHLGMCL